MRELKAEKVSRAVEDLVRRAGFILRKDVVSVLKKAYHAEKNIRSKKILKAILDNAEFARKENLAICQDTGMPIIFAYLGQEVRVRGDFKKAVNRGIAAGYKKYSLRNSVVHDPLSRGKPGFSPCIIHTEIVPGDKLKLILLPKGFGCENKSRLKMFNPTAGIGRIKEFIAGAVRDAGPDACPPYVVGVGIGGSADYSAVLAKKALLSDISKKPSKLEGELLSLINKAGTGPMGLGGKATALAVKVLTHPTHIAGLPVSVNISCHALRGAEVIL